MFVVKALRGLLRPARCLACGLPEAWPCCAGCLPSAPPAVGPWVLAADPDLPLWTLGPYRDALRTAVLAGKLDGQPAALTELGRRLGAALAGAGAGADLVTYVAARRVAGPPRDHAQRIAAGVATVLDLPLADLLVPAGGRDLGRARGARHPDLDLRSRLGLDRPPQTRPPPRARRRLAGGRVLLIDDLATTGGTLAAAATTLRLAGARQVEAAVLAASPSAVHPHPDRPAPSPRGRPAPPPRGRSDPPPRGRVALGTASGVVPAAASRGVLPPTGGVPGGPPARSPPVDPDDLPCSSRSHCVVVTRFRV